MQAAVDEARKFDLKVAAHAYGTQGIKDAVKAGVASIEARTFLDDECIALMKDKGTYLVADVYDDEFIQGEGKKRGMPKDFLEHDANLGQIQRDNFAKAVKAGVKNRLRHRCGRLSSWAKRQTIRLAGQVWSEPNGSDSIGDH